MYAQTKHQPPDRIVLCEYAKPILGLSIDCGESDFSVEEK